MKFEDFKKDKKVIHTLRREWGSGTVTQIFGDGSVLVYFPGRDWRAKHKHKNTFRYYNKGLYEFEPVGEVCESCGKFVEDFEYTFCCNGQECSCMGFPMEPCVCSQECLNTLIYRSTK